MNNNGPLLPFVLLSGLLDSINPCAIAVLLIFIGLMFTLRKKRSIVLGLGFTYIAAVYLTYLGIGLGLFRIFHLFGVNYLISKIGAVIVIVIGIWGLKDYFFPSKFQILAIPLNSRQLIATWAMKASFLPAIVAGALVGLTEFPCSGAVYVATLGLLTAQTTFVKGLFYLLAYNLMFVLPLIVILLVVTNRMVGERLLAMDETNSGKLRLISSLIMIGIGVAILIWFV